VLTRPRNFPTDSVSSSTSYPTPEKEKKKGLLFKPKETDTKMGCCNPGVGTENDEKKQFDPKFKGPLEWSERSCRDVWMILIYIAFWVGLLLVAYFGVGAGDPYRLMNGIDSFGNVCGRTNKNLSASANYSGPNQGLDMTNQGFVLIANPLNLDSVKLCVSACPTDSASGSGVPQHFCLNNASNTNSSDDDDQWNVYHNDLDQWGKYGIEANNGCPKAVIASVSLMKRCVPTGGAAADTVNAVMDSVDVGGIAQDFMSDLEASWPALLIILGSTLLVSIIFVFLMRCFAYVMIWIAYFALLVSTAGGIGLLWYMWHEKDSAYTLLAAGNITQTASAKSNVDLFLGLAIAWTILGGLFFILLLFMRKRIALVVALFQEAGKCIGTMPSVLFYPLFTLVSAVVCICYFLLIGLYLFSAGVETVDENNHVSYPTNMDFRYMSLYHLFGFYWSFEFTLAFQEAVLAGTAATWYFTRDKSDISWAVPHAMWRTIRFSLGSLLFGALIIAIIKIIRFLLHYFESKVKKISEKSTLASFIMKCVDCCLWCCEKCMKFLNRNAYIEIAIYGKSFCRSAMNAFAILLRNALRVAAINSIGDLVLLVCKLIITAIGVVAAFFYFQYSQKIESQLGAGENSALGGADNVQYESLQILLCGIFSYFIANMFIGVYEMLIDTIFICFAEDSERNDGTAQKPYFMSKNLLKFMSAEEKRTQKRTEKDAAHAQKKADAANATHSQAMNNNIDAAGGEDYDV